MYEKSRIPQPRYGRTPPKHDDNDSDWNENLYPQNYRAKCQSQVSPRQPLPGWPKGIRKESLPSPSHTENTSTSLSKTEEIKKTQP